MNRVSPRVKVNIKDASCVTTANNENPIGIDLPSKHRPHITPPPIQSLIDGWWLRADINMRKTPTEEEHRLEKMIFEYLWDMKVLAERTQEEVQVELG